MVQVPAATIFTTEPAMMQAVDWLENRIGLPVFPPLAKIVKAAALAGLSDTPPKMMVWPALATSTGWVTLVALAYLAFPAWSAATTQLPAWAAVSTFPVRVQTPSVTE